MAHLSCKAVGDGVDLLTAAELPGEQRTKVMELGRGRWRASGRPPCRQDGGQTQGFLPSRPGGPHCEQSFQVENAVCQCWTLVYPESELVVTSAVHPKLVSLSP